MRWDIGTLCLYLGWVEQLLQPIECGGSDALNSMARTWKDRHFPWNSSFWRPEVPCKKSAALRLPCCEKARIIWRARSNHHPTWAWFVSHLSSSIRHVNKEAARWFLSTVVWVRFSSDDMREGMDGIGESMGRDEVTCIGRWFGTEPAE